MKTLKFYAVTRNLDQTEGRGPIVDAYHTENKDLALKIAANPLFYKKYGVQGCCGGSYDVIEKNVTLLTSMEEFFDMEKNIKVQGALSKLNDEEKELLGLK